MNSLSPDNAMLVDTAEAARRLGLSPSMVRKLTRQGQLPSVLIGRARRYRVADLAAIAQSGAA